MPKQSRQVLMITPFFYPHRGGVETHVYHLCYELIKQGWRVKIITQKHEASLPDRDTINQIEIKRFSFPHLKIIGLVVIWWRVLIQTLSWARLSDVIHVHDVMLWCLPLRIVLLNKKFILTMHGWEGHYPVLKKERWLKYLSQCLANSCIGVGEYLQKYYHTRCGHWIYGGVNKDDFCEGCANQSGRLGKLAYLGRLANDTGLPMLIESLSELTQHELKTLKPVFIGDGEWHDKCALWGQVTGWRNDTKVKELLRQARVIIAGGYLSALEAWTAGCEVIALADNQLKQDYWLLSPFSLWVHLATSESELTELLRMTATNQLVKCAPSCSQLGLFLWSKVADLHHQIYLAATPDNQNTIE